MRPWVWISAALAPLLLIGGWTVAQTRQPQHYDAVRDTISALAGRSAVDAWIMTVGLAGLGACHLITAAGLPAVGQAARAVLALGGAATVVVAASPQPAAAHVPAATIAFAALALWPALTTGSPGRAARTGRRVAVTLLTLLGWFAIAVSTSAAVGLSERVLAAAEALAPLVVLGAVRRERASTVKIDR